MQEFNNKEFKHLHEQDKNTFMTETELGSSK